MSIFLGLGSNRDDKKANLEKAISFVKEKCTILAISSFYETEPVGCEDQEWFVNNVIEVSTALTVRA